MQLETISRMIKTIREAGTSRSTLDIADRVGGGEGGEGGDGGGGDPVEQEPSLPRPIDSRRFLFFA